MKAIQDFWAKPNKTIREHADDLKKRAYRLKEIRTFILSFAGMLRAS